MDKKVYQGQFQIVLDDSSSNLQSRLNQINPALAKISGFTKNKQLNTQSGNSSKPFSFNGHFQFRRFATEFK